MYSIRFAEGVEEDLGKIRVYYRNQILAAIKKQLTYTPDSPTRNRKLLPNLIPTWEAIPPIWELRIGEFRVFYDVSSEEEVVYVFLSNRTYPTAENRMIISSNLRSNIQAVIYDAIIREERVEVAKVVIEE